MWFISIVTIRHSLDFSHREDSSHSFMLLLGDRYGGFTA